MTHPSHGPTILLAISGDVAAYQAAEVARLLVAMGGARVVSVMRRDASDFIGARTLEGLTGEAVHDVQSGDDPVPRADVILFVPAPPSLLSRLASDRPDDWVTALALQALGTPVLAAPTQAVSPEIAGLLAHRGVELVRAPDAPGLVEPLVIAAASLARATPRDLAGLRVVVTAGPTVEDFDPVRFLGNRSTGKMGFAVAARAAARGATVTLIAGPVSLRTPYGVSRVDVRGALEMRAALHDALGPDLAGADALVMTAAVADYRPAETLKAKRKRTADSLTLELVPNPDLLAEIGAARAALAAREGVTPALPALVGFAVETDSDERVVAYARAKLEQKRVDLVVANHASDAFGRDDNRATLVDRVRAEALAVLPKAELADRILDRLARLCGRSAGPDER